MTIVETARAVTGGVDTHLDVHVASALEETGGVLGVESFPTTPAGYRQLHEWLCSFGEVSRVGVEGTGAYGAGLARFLHAMDVEVIEVDRPNRQARRRQGKRIRSRRPGPPSPARPADGPRPPTGGWRP
jgi:transposase